MFNRFNCMSTRSSKATCHCCALQHALIVEFQEKMSAFMLCQCIASKSPKARSHCCPLSHAVIILLNVTTLAAFITKALSNATRARIQSLVFSNAVTRALNVTPVGASVWRCIWWNNHTARCHFKAFEHALMQVLKVIVSGCKFRELMSWSSCKAQVHFELLSHALMVALYEMTEIVVVLASKAPPLDAVSKRTCKSCTAAAQSLPQHRCAGIKIESKSQRLGRNT